MNSIAIRADGSSNIGMGHIMRCLSLAKELQSLGQDVYFISRYEEGIAKIESMGYQVKRLPQAMNNEADVIGDILFYTETKILIIDSYNVSEELFISLKKNTKLLVYIDDINRFTYPVDVLVNGNINANDLGYKKFSSGEAMLLGTEYNLIRDEFKKLTRKETKKELKEILVTSGGSDPYDICYKISTILLKAQSDIKINIVIGPGFINKQLLYNFASKYKNIILHENASKLSEIMLRADLAISSGGSTLYELCACGIPTLAFVMADNQIGIVEKLQELEYIKSLGWCYEVSEPILIKNIDEMTYVNKREEISGRMQGLVDGLGAYRVANKIIELKKELS